MQIHLVGHFGRKARSPVKGNQTGQKREVVAHIRPGIETDRMRPVLYIAVQAAFIAIPVDRIQVKIDRWRQAGLMIEKVLNDQVLLI